MKIIKKPKKPVAPAEPVKPVKRYIEEVNKTITVGAYDMKTIQEIVSEAALYGVTDLSKIIINGIYDSSYDGSQVEFEVKGRIERVIDDKTYESLMGDYKSRHGEYLAKYEKYLLELGEYNKAMAEYEQQAREKEEKAELELLEKLKRKYEK